MTRTVLVFVMAALVCLALTGLRVAVMEHLSVPAPLVSPRTIKDPQPPEIQRPIEYIAGTRRAQSAPRMEPALSWAGALRSGTPRTARPE